MNDEPKTQARRSVEEQSYLGVDVSKGYADFCLMGGDGTVREEATFDDTERGHDSLRELLARALEQSRSVEVGLEATGGYERNWLQTLRSYADGRPVETDLVNALSVKRFAQQDLHGNKTDRISARRIASYLRKGLRKTEVRFEPHMEGPKAVIRMVRETTKRQAALKSRFQQLLTRANPELVQYCRNRLPEWLLKLVGRHPTARQLAAVSPGEITDIPFVTEERAKEVVAAAQKSVASQEDEDTGFALAHMARKLLELKKEIQNLKDEVAERLEGEEGVEILCTIPGISQWSATVLRSEIGPIDRFDSARELVAYVGLDPCREESGDRRVRKSISKRGNPRIRAILYTCTQSAVRHNPPVKALYDRLVDRGKHHMLAMTACMRKLLCIAYGCWKRREAFDPGHERRIKERKARGLKTEKQSEKDISDPTNGGAPQDMSLEAPISRTEAQRRREAAMPQKGVDP